MATSTISPLLDCLFSQCDGRIELRAVPATGTNGVKQAFMKRGDANTLTRFVGPSLTIHHYFGVATRGDASNGKAENCLQLPALFVDLDFKDLAEPLARQRLSDFPLPPTAVVQSGNGLHVYWVLREPYSVIEESERRWVKSLLRRLCLFLGGDLQSAEPARMLRIPGTMNPKYDPPRQARTESLEPDRAYSLDDFDDLLPPEPVETIQTSGPFVAPERILDGSRNDTLYRLGRSLKAKGLSRPAIAAALRAENLAKCEPPLPESEVENTVANAWTQPDRAVFAQNGTPPPRADEALCEPDPLELEPSEPDPMESEPVFQMVTPADSFITKYIQYAAMRTDAPLDAHEAMAFGVFSALASNVRLPIATTVKGWRLTLWLLYLVNSTEGRKSTTLDLAVDVIRVTLGEAALIHWEGSPQGLLQRLQTRDGETSVFVRDEYSGLMAGMNRGGHLAGLPQLLIKAYDGSVLENIRTRKRNADGLVTSDTDRVDSPYLVQIAAAPWDAFIERATIDNVLDGFLARFNIVMGSASGRALPEITEEIRQAGVVVYDEARAYFQRAQAIEQVAFASGVLARQWELEKAYRQRASVSARPDAAGPSLKRLAETALKLAALLAIEEAPGTVLTIREEHFEIAAQITDKWVENALRLVEALGRTTFQKDCQAVLKTIRQRSAGLPMSQLYRLHQRLRQRDFEEILHALETQDRIVIEKETTTKRGRPALLVRALKGAD